MPQPICFMVMPLARRPPEPRPAHRPEDRFDALWNGALRRRSRSWATSRCAPTRTSARDHQRHDRAPLLLRSGARGPDDPQRQRLLRDRRAARRQADGLRAARADWSSRSSTSTRCAPCAIRCPRARVDEASARAIRAALRRACWSRLAGGCHAGAPEHLPGYPDKIHDRGHGRSGKQPRELSAFQAEGAERAPRRRPARRADAAPWRCATSSLPAAIRFRLPNLAQELLGSLARLRRPRGDPAPSSTAELPAAIRGASRDP